MRQVWTIGLVRNAVKGNPQPKGTAVGSFTEGHEGHKEVEAGPDLKISERTRCRSRKCVSNRARGRLGSNRYGRADLAHDPEIGRDYLYDPVQHRGESRQVRVT
jgi:hypothetical protein